ncbi:GNAT family N-acetyltransferase [Roseomonas sp. SSH11]|uniref:GNAT family N-acetyltransferase n=1 Tax=Pararoseomonas baculiformis TaxID=2820812 RepID=A0ABS4AFB4_9PROT|nr:GNAT family N-acetyltransferase [Pararoseomonas baculiformis]MBP0445519.1 GNAT family N-acetyltransferase [Pararoseomonas baculiformis]
MTATGCVALRDWRDEDRAAFAAMNADPAVMRHFPATLSRAESDALMDRLRAHAAEHGFTFWAVEVAGELAGMCGLLRVGFEASFTPAVEIGWRFRPAFQGRGLATEAARLALARGFGELGLDRIVSFTTMENERSWRLMERLGMRRSSFFDHPRVPPGHRLRHHVWYALDRG